MPSKVSGGSGLIRLPRRSRRPANAPLTVTGPGGELPFIMTLTAAQRDALDAMRAIGLFGLSDQQILRRALDSTIMQLVERGWLRLDAKGRVRASFVNGRR